MRLDRNIAFDAALVAAIAIPTAFAIADEARASEIHASAPIVTSRACVHEDGSETDDPCIWDAGRSGNGIGTSVINIDAGDGYAHVRSPKRPVTNADPIRITIYSTDDQPTSMRVVHGRDVLARNAAILR